MARKLAPADRLELAEELLDSLDAAEDAIDRAWATEAENRLAAYRRGEIVARPLADILAKYQTK